MDKCKRKPYTQAELEQQAIWADEFDQWWESEGQYHRAGGGNYERTFAWWAWLSREQSRQSEFEAITEALLNQTQLLAKQKVEVGEKDKRIGDQKDFIEMALNSLNHLKENAVTHRDYGHECNWVRSFNDLIKLADDAEDALKQALRGDDDINVTR